MNRRRDLCILYAFVILLIVIAVYGLYAALAPDKPSGEADRTGEGSYDNLINANIARRENWEQIVFDSPFQIAIRQVDRLTPLGTYPYIEGSTVCIPMGAEFARQHLGMDDDGARRFSRFSTTPVAYDMLIRRTGSIVDRLRPEDRSFYIGPGVVDLILVTQPSDDELSRASQAGVELVIEPICWDAFVFITHKDNPVNSLTIEQIRQIYSGDVEYWSELGGLNQKIVAYQREQNSGSQTTMEKQVMGGLPMMPAPMARILEGMGNLVDAVSEYVNDQYSIGYTFRYYVDNLYLNEDIKILEIDGISPADENIRDRSYPFATIYYAVYRQENKDGTAGEFVAWILSEEGQRCIELAGYVPIN